LRELRRAVADVIERLPDMRARAQRLDNRALFELPEILAEQLFAASFPLATRLSSSVATLSA
jgi:hypothetical protein